MTTKNIKEIFTYDELPEAFPYLPDVCVDLEQIRVVFINEIVPEVFDDDFYGSPTTSPYAASALSLFHRAGIEPQQLVELLEKGIYITNAVKVPKDTTTISRAKIEQSSYLLEKELELFPNVQIIMAMGDVAIKSINMISKRKYRGNVIPSGSTYRLRKQSFYMQNIRVMPSYIMTGTNLKIEKSKGDMIVEDLAVVKTMLNL